jgi:hypothetical protein
MRRVSLVSTFVSAMAGVSAVMGATWAADLNPVYSDAGKITMTDAMVTISSELENLDPIDHDRLVASLDHLSAFLREAGANNDTGTSSSDE